MTQNKIIEMAKQAGIKRRTDEFYSEFCDGVYTESLEAFAALVAAAEREACARACEERGMVQGGEVFAARIRARGNT